MYNLILLEFCYKKPYAITKSPPKQMPILVASFGECETGKPIHYTAILKSDPAKFFYNPQMSKSSKASCLKKPLSFPFPRAARGDL